ncbi:MAG: hypothetical protein IPL59_08670 [Candidatus Competibacteraceae bacterium]|nr:hypothetical protein [Candidatus Competibacteraceae bacterium]MBK8755496.1 hypothetical protein [Candidatus Competibacteraceae bacterium]MBK8755513.1 hypothetical protein [Candidatus Competibacteraceae bacterium]
METQTADKTQGQALQRWQEIAANDPAFEAWNAATDTRDHAAFEAWLNTKEGRAWLYAEEFEATSREEMGYAY